MRYLLIPKVDDVADAFSDEPMSMRPAARAQALDRLLQARHSSAAGRPGSLERASAMPGNVRVIAAPTLETPITGITVLEANEAQADAIDEAFPDHDRVEDFALDLIAPPESDAAGEEDVGGSVGDVSEADLWHLDAVGLLAARRLGFDLRGEGVTVAVLDTGVADVPELAGRIIENRTFDPATGQYVDAPLVDTHTLSHGTHVAGLIAGRTVGIAPGARLVSLTTIPDGTGSLSHWVFALEYAQTLPDVQIINSSAGKPGQVPQMRYMMKIARRLDVFSVMAIGNDGANTSRSPGNYPEVISVGASDARGRIWEGSGGGTTTWDGRDHTVPTLVAPGVDVVSCVADGTYRRMTGTSMATPIVTGLAALIIGRYPDITVDQLREELLSACSDLNVGVSQQGAGAARLPPSLLRD